MAKSIPSADTVDVEVICSIHVDGFSLIFCTPGIIFITKEARMQTKILQSNIGEEKEMRLSMT